MRKSGHRFFAEIPLEVFRIDHDDFGSIRSKIIVILKVDVEPAAAGRESFCLPGQSIGLLAISSGVVQLCGNIEKAGHLHT